MRSCPSPCPVISIVTCLVAHVTILLTCPGSKCQDSKTEYLDFLDATFFSPLPSPPLAVMHLVTLLSTQSWIYRSRSRTICIHYASCSYNNLAADSRTPPSLYASIRIRLSSTLPGFASFAVRPVL